MCIANVFFALHVHCICIAFVKHVYTFAMQVYNFALHLHEWDFGMVSEAVITIKNNGSGDCLRNE